MRSIDDYLDLAREAQGFNSDRKIGLKLGVASAVISNYRTGKTLPADAHMVAISQMAGIDPEVALAELNFWRTAHKGDMESAGFYQKMATKMASLAASIALICGVFLSPEPASAAVQSQGHNSASSIYYVKLGAGGIARVTAL
ncbi:MAG: hypothetical protein AAF221_08305 [Pseudomonadota bacterium]